MKDRLSNDSIFENILFIEFILKVLLVHVCSEEKVIYLKLKVV